MSTPEIAKVTHDMMAVYLQRNEKKLLVKWARLSEDDQACYIDQVQTILDHPDDETCDVEDRLFTSMVLALAKG